MEVRWERSCLLTQHIPWLSQHWYRCHQTGLCHPHHCICMCVVCGVVCVVWYMCTCVVCGVVWCVYMCGVCVIPARAVYPRHDVSTTNSPFSPSKCCVWVPESISSSIVETQIEEHQQQRVNLASSINLTLCKHLGSQFGSQFRSFVQTMTSLVAKFPSLLRPAARSPALVGLTQQVRKPTVVRIVWYSRLCMSCCNLHKLIFNLHPRHAHREVSGWLATWDRP